MSRSKETPTNPPPAAASPPPRYAMVLASAAAIWLCCAVVFQLSYRLLDRLYPPQLQRFEAVSHEVVAADGSLLRLFPVEDGRVRRRAHLHAVDPGYVAMLTAYEDKRFYQHMGIDPYALVRAVWQAATSGRIISGGSTLTMQTARLLEPRPRTLWAKAAEMFRAFQLEQHYSKADILEMYLTLAPYGGNIEGIEAASYAYFGHSAQRLRADEAALLVALPQSPERLRPDRHPERAVAARNKILRRTQEAAGVAPHTATLAANSPVPTTQQTLPVAAPHLAEKLYREAQREAQSKAQRDVKPRANAQAQPQAPTRTVSHTYINASLQARLQARAYASAAHVHPQASAAVLVVESTSRKVIAYVGSADYLSRQRSGFVDMAQAVRSPGSTLKPFIYGMAFDRDIAHPNTKILDTPHRFGAYAPSNFSGTYSGEVTMAEALQRSLNIPAVAVLDRIGPVQFTHALRRTGITLSLPGHEQPGLAVALGGIGTRLIDLVQLYSSLASDGLPTPLAFSPQDRGTTPDAPSGPDVRGARAPFAFEVASPAQHTPILLSDAARAALTDILSDVSVPRGRLAYKYQAQKTRTAFKTGTSYGFRDAWAIGYSGDYTVGVWIGRADGTPLPGHFGANTAAPLLFDVFDMLPDLPQTTPQGQHTRRQLAASNTDRPLPPGLLYFDQAFSRQAGAENQAPLAISFPQPESVLEWEAASAPITLAAHGGTAPLQWFINGVPLESDHWAKSARYQPDKYGFFKATVTDANGQSAAVSFSLQAPQTNLYLQGEADYLTEAGRTESTAETDGFVGNRGFARDGNDSRTALSAPKVGRLRTIAPAVE